MKFGTKCLNVTYRHHFHDARNLSYALEGPPAGNISPLGSFAENIVKCRSNSEWPEGSVS